LLNVATEGSLASSLVVIHFARAHACLGVAHAAAIDAALQRAQ
jgi:hypothetical protein